MVEQKEGEGYRQVSLPGGLYKRIEDKVANSKGDFKSVADYVKYVIRRSLEGDETDNAPPGEVLKEAT
jgi:Arc/MetJ-type ribon-helix-helix transcriptional regulator